MSIIRHGRLIYENEMITITCDMCGYDLTHPGSILQTRLTLKSEKIALQEEIHHFEVDSSLPIGEFHFCSKSCLDDFLEGASNV